MGNPTKCCRLCSKSFAGWGDICQVCRRIPGGVSQACKECGAFFQGFKPIRHDCEKTHHAQEPDFSVTGGLYKQKPSVAPVDTKPKGYGRYGRDPVTGKW